MNESTEEFVDAPEDHEFKIGDRVRYRPRRHANVSRYWDPGYAQKVGEIVGDAYADGLIYATFENDNGNSRGYYKYNLQIPSPVIAPGDLVEVTGEGSIPDGTVGYAIAVTPGNVLVGFTAEQASRFGTRAGWERTVEVRDPVPGLIMGWNVHPSLLTIAPVPSAPEQEGLAEFKDKVYKRAKEVAKDHGWCSVVDDLLAELGIEAKPVPTVPFPGAGVYRNGSTIYVVPSEDRVVAFSAGFTDPRIHETSFLPLIVEAWNEQQKPGYNGFIIEKVSDLPVI